MLTQRAACDKLRSDEVAAICLAKIIDGKNVRVIERAGRAGFTFQTEDPFRAVEAGRQEFQRRLSSQSRIVGEINRAHAASTQFSHQAVVPNHFTAESLRI